MVGIFTRESSLNFILVSVGQMKLIHVTLFITKCFNFFHEFVNILQIAYRNKKYHYE